MNSFAVDKFKKAFDLITDVDKVTVRSAINSARSDNSTLNNVELATQLFNDSRLIAVASGFGLGVAGNPLVILPAAIADITITTKIEVFAAACVAEIFEEGFLDSDTAKYELLVPIFGASALDQFAAELGVSAGKVLTKDLIKKFLSKGTLKQFKKIMLKYFGIKVTQKGIITKSLPIVGGLIGAGWNAIEVSIMKQRVIDYFREEAILTEVIIVDELGKT